MTSTYITTKLKAVVFLAAVALAWCSNEWQNEMILDTKGDFQMLWNLTKENITIEVQVRTKGYVGLGFSPHGGMKAADIVIGWVNDSQVNLQDRYATGNIEPIIDDNQDYELISGFENDTHTVLRFTRLLDTCDNQDLEIEDGTMRIIYAWGNDDNIEYHGGENRGTKVFNPIRASMDGSYVTDDMYPWDFQMPKVTLPPVETTYWCQYMRFPAAKKKQHGVGLAILVQPGNEKIVHHAFVSQCLKPMSDIEYENQVNGPGFSCEKNFTTCPIPVVGWSFGSPRETLPPHVGFLFGEVDIPTYYLVQIHYHNPSLRSDIVDQTTVRLLFTEELRPHEASALAIISVNMIIPPQQENFTYTSYCPSECTKKMLPKDGINIFGAFLHGHTKTTKMHIRHFRDGVELPLITYDNNYDFELQFRADIVKEVKVLPGDILATQCEYNTMNESRITIGGTEVDDEMCNAFILYYPAAKLMSTGKTGPYEELVQILKNAERRQSTNNSTIGLRMPNKEYVKNFDTSFLTKQDIADLSYIQTFGAMQGICFARDNSFELFKTQYPQNITRAISYESTTCRNAKKRT